MYTLIEAHEIAKNFLFQGDHVGALRMYAMLIRREPNDLEGRLRAADALLALGEVQRAAEVYAAVARLAVQSGHPLRAIVAVKVLATLEPTLKSLWHELGELYGCDSTRLGRASRLSLEQTDSPISELPGGGVGLDVNARTAIVVDAASIARDVSSVAGPFPHNLPPIPLLSQLPSSAFAAILDAADLVRLRPDAEVLRDGEDSDAFYLVLRGSVQVWKAQEKRKQALASLYEGAVLGEIGMICNQPRTANVSAESDCDLLRFDRKVLAAESSSIHAFIQVLERFAYERMLTNVLSSSGLFQPLTAKQRMDLIRRFMPFEVTQGDDMVREGEIGKGLFLLLRGSADVWKTHEGDKRWLATLKPGDVFGELSLIRQAPATATVTAASPSTVLFLAKEFFDRLVSAVPTVRAYVEELGRAREKAARVELATLVQVELEEDEQFVLM